MPNQINNYDGTNYRSHNSHNIIVSPRHFFWYIIHNMHQHCKYQSICSARAIAFTFPSNTIRLLSLPIHFTNYKTITRLLGKRMSFIFCFCFLCNDNLQRFRSHCDFQYTIIQALLLHATTKCFYCCLVVVNMMFCMSIPLVHSTFH